MSMMGGRMPQSRDEVGQAVASFPTYEAAQKAVSTLIAADIPARDIAIVGQNLRSVERVTGRLGYASAARSGAINGMLLGLLFSAVLVIGSPSVPIQAFVGVLFVGIAIGMLLSIVTYSFVRRRRDFASVMQVVADRYEVTVGAGSIQRARQVLGTPAPSPTPDAAPPVPGTPATEPPRFGERVAVAGEPGEQPIPEGEPGDVEIGGPATTAEAPEGAGPSAAPEEAGPSASPER
ncbi:general stress protein [Microbacterium deminutum]|uniref:General stress protein 17M-like domain-containing protein n=1 Tax=Microbacterium deminutum TaxID=344164 RepID=A0ABN2QVS6_9MICO